MSVVRTSGNVPNDRCYAGTKLDTQARDIAERAAIEAKHQFVALAEYGGEHRLKPQDRGVDFETVDTIDIEVLGLG
jgi:hypothetical protein